MSRGLLIVNADDFGFSQTATDPVIAAYDEGLVSSTTAMVWMRDSERAGTLARERGVPVGLHLNLTVPFGGDQVPELARELQMELTNRFDSSSSGNARGWRVRIREAVAHQLEAFRAQFGEPTHIDGHHHVHMHRDVLACLPLELPIRLAPRLPDRLSARANRRERLARKRFRTPDGCVSLPQIHPSLGGSGLDALSFSQDRVLEVIVHPQLEAERQAIHGAEWRIALAPLELGSYRDLP